MNSNFLRRKFLYKIFLALAVVAVTAVTIVLFVTDEEYFHLVGSEGGVRTQFILLWVMMVAIILSLIYDVKTIRDARREHKELEYKLYSDIASGIANRYYCDIVIDRYVDSVLPEDFSCAMLAISNIQEINSQFGRKTGTKTIVEFSKMLVSASKDICFVGRNSGNQFLAIFEHAGSDKVEEFKKRLEKLVNEYNKDKTHPEVHYAAGIAENRKEKTDSIISLISLADERALDSQLEEIIF